MNECRLLVLDADPETMGIISEALADQGYVIRLATNGDEARLVIAREHPALALIHVGQTDQDTLAVIRDLKELSPDLTVLIIGGGPEAWKASVQVGAVGYVADPLDVSALIISVEQVCPLVQK